MKKLEEIRKLVEDYRKNLKNPDVLNDVDNLFRLREYLEILKDDLHEEMGESTMLDGEEKTKLILDTQIKLNKLFYLVSEKLRKMKNDM